MKRQLSATAFLGVALFVFLSAASVAAEPSSSTEPLDVGSRRELFIDSALIKKLDGDKLVDTKLSGDPEYFVIYGSAKW